MKWTDIATIRLRSQRIAGTNFKKPEELVGWMGAMQAQDFNMSKWAVGLRLEDGTARSVENAINTGKILRTHVMRPTWHLVRAEDLHWLLALTAPNIRRLMQSRNRQLELTEKVFTKTWKLLEKALAGGGHLTRDELLEKFRGSGIVVDENRGGHILMEAELEGLICSGPVKNKKQTYALLEERAPHKKKVDREEALAMLAQKYFSSHGPATIRDFAWWSGLSVTESKQALEMVKKDLATVTLRSEAYWFDPSFEGSHTAKSSVFLLPAYDEFIIAYKDRTASVILDHHAKVISSNGIFWPTVVVNGRVSGMWGRRAGNNKIIIDIEYFKPHGKSLRAAIKKCGKAFGGFLGMEDIQTNLPDA